MKMGTLWANAYKLGLCSFDDSVHGCHESIGIEYGIFSTLSAIAAEMGQLQNEIQERRRVLNLFLRSVRTLDPARKEARIRAAKSVSRIWRGGSKRCGRSSKHS
nr:ribose-phosphate pyrophosphokinase 1-like [Ipomoea batatas]